MEHSTIRLSELRKKKEAMTARTKRNLDSNDQTRPSKLAREDNTDDACAADVGGAAGGAGAAATSPVVHTHVSDAAAPFAEPIDTGSASPTTHQVSDLGTGDDDVESVTILDDADFPFCSSAKAKH